MSFRLCKLLWVLKVQIRLFIEDGNESYMVLLTTNEFIILPLSIFESAAEIAHFAPAVNLILDPLTCIFTRIGPSESPHAISFIISPFAIVNSSVWECLLTLTPKLSIHETAFPGGHTVFLCQLSLAIGFVIFPFSYVYASICPLPTPLSLHVPPNETALEYVSIF